MVVIKIFNANDRDFNTAGNIIIEPLYCHEIKKKSLNGWYIDVEIPIKYKEYIEQDKLCVVKTKSKLKPQAFRIKDIEYTTNKIVFQARHVMFDAEDYFLLDVRPINQNGLNALNYINERTDIVSPFTMYSNVENTNTAYFIRKNLLEAWSTIEEKWNGVFDADNWDISFLVSVGNDKGETIYYRKNLEDMKIIEDWSGVCTKLYPIGKDEMMLPSKYLESETQYDIPYTRTIKFDTQLSDEEQTEENLLNELETNAINYLQENCVPKVCYEINSNISQEMEIGDIIQVKHPLCNISTEVLEYEYDAILEKVIKLVFGNYSKDVKKKFKAVTESIEFIKEAVNKQQTTINNQTNLINSLNKNGYVYIDENEILILDTIPKEKAKNVWRFGLGGIGFSSNGYEGPFEVAMTMDGQINANFITTGTLSVSRIEGLTNFISETEKQISNIEIQQGNITSRVESVESNIVNLQSQIDGSIQFWNGSDIPTASNYPASEWTTEEEKNKHRADIYTVIEDVDGELKQGKSYRFDKVGNTWQWIELTDNELSAVQALAQSKAKVFVTTPKVPYSIGDLWLNNGKLYECQVSKDASGSYSASDWKEAVNYTDDTVANLAKTLANNAQSTADSAVEGVSNITNTTGQAEGKNIHIEDSAEEPLVDISLHGETRQETRSGKNLLDLSKSSFVRCKLNSDNKSITCNMTDYYFPCISTTQLNEWLLNNKGKTITFSIGTLLTGKYISIVIYGTRTNGQTVQEAAKISAESISITIAEDFTEITRLELRFNRTYETFTDTTTTISYAMIELGNEATEYEAYGAMPSPEFPSEIENVEGKNKLNIDNLSNTAPSSNISIKDGVISQTSADTKTNLEWHLQTYNDSGYVSTVSAKTQNTTGSISHKFIKYSSITALRFGLNGSQRNTMVYIPINHLKDGKTYTISAKIINATQGSVGWTDMQIEEGTVATPYAPYNSLEVKVEGKNRFSSELVESFINRINNTEIARIDKRNGKEYLYFKANSGYVAGQNFTEHIQYLAKGIFEEKTQYTFSSKMIFNTERTEANICFRYTDGTYSVKHLSSKAPAMTEFDYSITSAPNKTVYSLSVFYEIGFTYIDLSTATLQKGTETNYEPYKTQTAYFPLAEGQKLMEGSYLADDGIHNKHSQALVNIEATVKLSNGNVCGVYYPKNKIYKNNNYIVYSNAIFTPSGHTLRFQEETIYENEANVVIVGNTNDTLATLKEKYDGAILEYELAEEEIVPYTEEQQEAWNKIKALATYKNITNITSDAYAKVVYMRDNGLDIYETKQNADKRYTETTEKFAETKITTDSIKDTVSTTQTTVANNYQELKGKFDDYAPKSDIITIQNSVEKIQTDTYTKTEINTKLKDGSVTKVLTTAGTFDENGLTIEKTNAKTKGNFNEKGITVMDATSGSSQELLFAGYDEELNETIVRSKNMTVEKYFVIGNTARQENYTNPVLGGKGVGVFML